MEISDEKIEAYALENATRHGGTAREGSVISALFSEGIKKEELGSILPRIKEIVNKVNLMKEPEQKRRLEEIGIKISKREARTGLPRLPNAKKGSVVMRFAPFPSGALHIGNSRTLILNDEYAKEYSGKLLLVIDDTIGSEDKPIVPEAYDLIVEGAKYLEADFDENIIKKSDRMEIYYEHAERLIKAGAIYICKCSRDKIRKNKAKCLECKCRKNSASENLKLWKKMFSADEGEYCARLKTSMSDEDPAFRDRIMLRISKRPHPITGRKYQVYPLLDFSWAIDDHLLGITHILRGMELAIETRTEFFIFDLFGWKKPEVIYNGHFEIKGIKISKSKGALEVRSGKYIGWNDPRTWSIQSLRDRGILAKSIREFILSMGLKKTNVTTPIDVLYSINRRNLNDSKRFFFIENPVEIKIKNAPKTVAKVPLHPNKDFGHKEHNVEEYFLISKKDFDNIKDQNMRLMHLLNFKKDGGNFVFISTEPNPDLKPSFIHWLPKNENNAKVTVRMPDNSLIEGLGERQLRDLKEGEIVQFERFGFARLYKKKIDSLEFWFAHD